MTINETLLNQLQELKCPICGEPLEIEDNRYDSQYGNAGEFITVSCSSSDKHFGYPKFSYYNKPSYMYERITSYLNHYKTGNKCLHCGSNNVNRDLYETRYIPTIKEYADIINVSCNDCGCTMQIPITIINEE